MTGGQISQQIDNPSGIVDRNVQGRWRHEFRCSLLTMPFPTLGVASRLETPYTTR
jgi:hypothetical protein